MLEEASPEGVPTRGAAARLLGDESLASRARIQRAARALRKAGLPVWGHKGLYRLRPGPAFLLAVCEGRAAAIAGTAASALRLLRDFYEARPSPEEQAAMLRVQTELAQALSRLARELADFGIA